MQFELPESYRAYCSDTAVRTAVDHILSADSKAPLALPADIEWQDLPAFHRAVLSAHQVRCEFAVFMIKLWNAVWQPALDRCENGRDPKSQSVADTQIWHSRALDTNTVWADGWYGRNFDVDRKNLDLALAVQVGSLNELQLSLCLWGKDDTDHTTGVDFGDGWPEQDCEEGVAWTGKDLAPIGNDGTIDLQLVRKAADDALAAVRARIRG